MKSTLRGFTLIEMMIVFAIVGILSSIALPSYQTYLLRAKAVEVVSVLEKLRTVLASFQADNGSINDPYYVYSPNNPPAGTSVLKYGECKNGKQQGPAKELSGISQDDLHLTNLGIRIVVSSCSSGANSPGQYQVLVVPVRRSDTQARQVALAVAHTMRSQAYKTESTTSGIISLFFKI
jgi:prepilin-type N-terminal cleavage/methylation domain-containing protein